MGIPLRRRLESRRNTVLPRSRNKRFWTPDLSDPGPRSVFPPLIFPNCHPLSSDLSTIVWRNYLNAEVFNARNSSQCQTFSSGDSGSRGSPFPSSVHTTEGCLEAMPSQQSLAKSQAILTVNDPNITLGDDDNIYRTSDLPSPHPASSSESWYVVSGAPEEDIIPVSLSRSDISTSSSEVDGQGKFAALATKLEQAIARWAASAREIPWTWRSPSLPRTLSRTSSLSSRSFVTSQLSLRRVMSVQTVNSENEVIARINRMKALEEFQRISRQFTLYLPTSLSIRQKSRGSIGGSGHDNSGQATRTMTRTSSLPLVLSQLDVALRKTRAVRRQSHEPNPTHGRGRSLISQPFWRPRPQRNSAFGILSNDSTPNSRRKGKCRASLDIVERATGLDGRADNPPEAWLLDIASPTWEDLIAIGKLLHLHPMTLDNILQQDTREKFDVFPKLGYYYVSFRAFRTRHGQEQLLRSEKMEEYLESIGDEAQGLAGEVMIYLVVFSEGVCCFHYKDVTDHTERIRNRIPLLTEVVNLSSDWIVHDIIDSIVASFFPYLDGVEKEVLAIDDIVFTTSQKNEAKTTAKDSLAEKFPKTLPIARTAPINQTSVSTLSSRLRPGLANPKLVLSFILQRARQLFTKREKRPSIPAESLLDDTALTLRRIGRVTRLITSLSRILSGKSEVVNQIRKRLKTGGSGRGSDVANKESEVEIYMGGVQDRILTMQQSLKSYETMLARSHPAYVLGLEATARDSKTRTIKAMLFANGVYLTCYLIAPLVGVCSMNVTVPSSQNLSYFGYVVLSAFGIFSVWLAILLRWIRQATINRNVMLKRPLFG